MVRAEGCVHPGLTLLHLGIRGIYLGPTLPAFVSPGVLDVLVREFDVPPHHHAGGGLEGDFGVAFDRPLDTLDTLRNVQEREKVARRGLSLSRHH